MSKKNIYEIMHMDRRVAAMNDSGQCKIYYKSFMPYNLYLEEADDIDTLVNNITNFNYWLFCYRCKLFSYIKMNMDMAFELLY